ncbi:MAG: hypothetical protein F8N36_13230 [Desulfovibrio sp.]|uniref:hypothetical protein n=1 Tax=Desulfovibrio sp. TaxID=885 RepID=UPI00135D2B0F|nr:hypothetical protein [Desulfovibrio sp.]MTJ93802.1 hypothetical protein [Desulfovibrio sp.]
MKTDKTNADFGNKPPFRADHVDSFLRSETIKKARKQLQDEEITLDDLRSVEDKAIRLLVENQKQCGLEAVTDGEFLCSLWHLDFFAGLDGIQKKQPPARDLSFMACMPRTKVLSWLPSWAFPTTPYCVILPFSSPALATILLK